MDTAIEPDGVKKEAVEHLHQAERNLSHGETEEARVEIAEAIEELEGKHIDIGIIVNGRAKTVHTRRVSYEEAVHLAFPSGSTAPDVSYTVLFEHAANPEHPKGRLAPGESVRVKEGTEFRVRDTSKS